MNKRRELLLAFAALAVAPGLRAQPERVRRVGVLLPSESSARLEVQFSKRMAGLGWTAGRNLALEVRKANNHLERLPALAAELVGLKVDVLVSATTPATRAAKEAAGPIPVVFTWVGDPVGVGFVASLARPGGNVTGLCNIAPDITPKQLELLKALRPGLARAGATAMVINPLPMYGGLSKRIAQLSTEHRIAAISQTRVYPDAGGLISYGSDLTEQFLRTTNYVDRILRGAKPADLPVEQPERFELVVNLKAAKALGISVPQTVLLQATEVIE